MRANLHPQNEERLRTLEGYDILDTFEEAEFDEIVQLAARICDVPISLISLVDTERQWFKARVGLDQSETPIDQSICAHAILQDDVFEIPDTLLDARTADNPLVTGPDKLRFYAGAPLVASNGLPIGTLCVLDREPRKLTDLQRETLRVLARQVMKQLELKAALRDQEILKSEMDHRVKNSLQTTASLVRMYGRTVHDPNAVEALKAINRRIDAMSTLHEMLQSSTALADVDMAEYLPGIINLLGASAPPNITVVSHCDKIRLSSANASDIGVIVSEFVANSIKHGFPDERSGLISVSLTDNAEGGLLLEATDDGIGSGRDEVLNETTGIGLSIVAAAASSLGGTLDNTLTADGGRLLLSFGNT